MVNWLTLGEPVSSSGINSLTILYYVVGIIAVIAAGLWGLKKYNDGQRDKWQKQGNKEQQLLDKLDQNINATAKNTAAIEKSSERLADFVTSVNDRFNVHDLRIMRLEDKFDGKK